jgi:ABC-type uncharacterized transport system substrate-binding protein
MRRRTLISLVGSSAIVWPGFVAAQSADRQRRIALLAGGENDPERQANRAAFEQGLQSLGWTSGRNIVINDRQYGADASLAKVYAREVGLAPDVILTTGAAGIRAMLEQTRTIPIVFTCLRSSRTRLCPKSCTSRRERDRIHQLRVHNRRQMATNAQRGCTKYYACGDDR